METITDASAGQVTNPIAPPLVNLVDSATGEHILATQWLHHFPKKPKGALQLDMYIDEQDSAQSQRLHLMCVIDSLDQATKTIYVTLNKVYLNDVQQYPLPTAEAPPPVLPAPEEPPTVDTPPALPPESLQES